jgi:hypothetical protein
MLKKDLLMDHLNIFTWLFVYKNSKSFKYYKKREDLADEYW